MENIPDGAIPVDQFQAAPQASATNMAPPGAIPVDQFQSEQDVSSTPGQQALTVAEGLGEGFAGPLKTAAEAALTKIGVPGLTPADQERRAQANPIEHYGSNFVGFGAGALTGTGEAGLLAKLGEGAVHGMEVSKIAQTGIKAGVELAALQSGDEVSKAINQDPSQTLGSAAANIGLSGLLGAGGGVALGAVAPLFKNSIKKLGISKIATDFQGETKFLQENPDMVQGATQEISSRMQEADQILNGGLKGEAIAATLPKATPENLTKIDDHLFEISNTAFKRIQEASDNAYLKNAVPKLTQDLTEFQKVITDPAATIEQKWNALDDFKRASQGHANYNTLIGGAEEKAVSKWIKPFNAELREAAESSKIWGEAGNIQRDVNKAASKIYDVQKDFLPKVTGKELGERIADPTKLQTLLNQTEKGKGGLRANAVKNYLEATQEAADAINKAHVENGLEQPLSSTLNPTPVLDRALNTEVSPGRSLAQWANRKGANSLAEASGNAVSGGVGGIAGALVGHPLLGAWAGEKILGPVLGVLAKPFAEQAVNASAMRSSVDYLANAAKGEATLSNSVKALLQTGGKAANEILPKHMVPTPEKRKQLGAAIERLQNPSVASAVGGEIGHYLPDHAIGATQLAAQASNYLNSLKPNEEAANPFDKKPVIDKAAQTKYNRALDIAEQPLMVLQHAKDGTILPQDIQTLQALYPGFHAALANKIMDEVTSKQAKGEMIPYSQKKSLSMLLGTPIDSTMQPQNMQAVIASAAGQTTDAQKTAVKQGHASGATLAQMNKVNSLYQTPLESRATHRDT